MDDVEFKILGRFYKDSPFSKEEFRREFKTHEEFFGHDEKSMGSAIDIFLGKEYLESTDGTFHERSKYQITKLGQNVYQYESRIRKEVQYRNDLQKTLTKTSISNNRLSPMFAGLAFAATVGSFVISLKALNKSTPEELKPTLQHIESSLREQRQELDSLKQTLRNVDFHLQLITDSLGKK
jgi:hypothetical protein